MTATTEQSNDCDSAVIAPILFGHFEGVPAQAEAVCGTVPGIVPGAVQCLCPFCGSFHSGIGRACSGCMLEDTDATRATTERQLGNWFILQTNNPSAPGINLDTLRLMIRDNRVTGRAVVRGPSTGQLWRLACKVRGLSREFGLCYNCAEKVNPNDARCRHCDRLQTLPEETVADTARFRQPPKDDRLTARDVAKAFDVEFGSTDVSVLLKSKIPSGRPMKIAILAGAILVAGALVWPITAALAGRQATKSTAVAAADSPVAPNQTLTFRQSEQHLIASTEAVVAPKPVDVPLPTPPTAIMASARIKPVDVEPVQVIAMVSPPKPTAAANEPATVENDNPAILFNAGLDAESRGDFATAVKVYEQIESLPGNEWPSNLKTRLTLARAGLKGDLR